MHPSEAVGRSLRREMCARLEIVRCGGQDVSNLNTTWEALGVKAGAVLSVLWSIESGGQKWLQSQGVGFYGADVATLDGVRGLFATEVIASDC